MYLVYKEDIINYIPQRIPFIMVDNLISISNNEIVAKVRISDNNVFAKEGIVSFYGILEFIAQSTALGYGFTHENCIGVIGKISDCICIKSTKTNNDILSNISIEKELDKSLLISAKCFQDNQKILKCNMYLYFS